MFSSTLGLTLAFAVYLSLGAPVEDRFPRWTVNIIRNKKVVCAGTLINSKFFLTLRRCINEKELEDYKVVVGDEEVRQVSYILKRSEGDDIITARMSEKVIVAQPDIARIPRIASEAQVVKARQNSRDNYAHGINRKGNDLTFMINVLPDKKCRNDFERGRHICFSTMSSRGSVCSLMPGSPVISYLSGSWTLLGLAPYSKSCNDEQTIALNVASHRRWINKIRSLNAGSICTSHDDCGKNMKCEKNKCACTYCYKPEGGKCIVADKKVLVIGAGMAGVAAAKSLGEKGCSNALILEGSNRIGGRLKSFNMSGYTVELGAQWIYGLGSNPMVALANEYGLAIAPYASSAVVRDKFGNDVTEEAFKEWYRLRSVMKKAKEFGRKLQRDHKPDITYEALLRKFGWNPVDIAAEAMESYELDIINGKETPSVSGKYSDTLRAFEEHNSYVWMIASDPRGYSYIIEEMVRGFRNGQSISFNKTVTSIINWDDENAPVKVFTEDGSIYEADDVIITVSLGVLQSRKISFNPPLSENKMMAIDKFGFGQNTLVYLKFPTAFWDNVSAIVYASERRGKYNTWFNMNYVYPGCNILQVNANGFEGEAVERMTDAETVEELMGIFRSMYPDANISQPESIVKSDWLTDPLTMGSYCYWTPAFRPEDMDSLGMSEGNLHFAGECISQTNYGFVHSAYTSGIHAAMDLAESVNLEEMFDKDKKK